MPTLDSAVRNELDRIIVSARNEAEQAVARALTTLGVDQHAPFPSLSEEERRLRNQLRAKAQQLGDRSLMDGRKPLSREWMLVRECAYEQWHRMLFARFLAENGLLMHPDWTVPVSLDDCAQIAAEEGIADPWLLVARYAAYMLPGIFRPDDPLLKVQLAPEGQQALERLLEGIPRAVFTSEDGLGWVYQFWQSKRKAEVNASGVKIGGADIAPVTQLFTEPYMVQFLLHNTLGAWWATRHPDDPLVAELTYLRRLDDGTPAAGTFDSWPQRAAEVTVMDPCCGSGHFLVAAFDLLRRMRMAEEGLDETEAGTVVIRDNLFGLEIDPRCTQIAAFALVFAAWKVGGYRILSLPNIACSGIGISGRVEEWTNLAGDDRNLAIALERLYHLFKDAPTLGSLINPTDVPLRDRMFTPDFARIAPSLQQALVSENSSDDPVANVFGAMVEGVARAASLLYRTYTLVITNVPYLTRVKQSKTLMDFCDIHHPDAKMDLATAFVERCSSFSALGATYGLVTPQTWLFLSSYKNLRRRLLQNQCWNLACRLGTGAFGTISGAVVNIAMSILTNESPDKARTMVGLDASAGKTVTGKAQSILSEPLEPALQARQLQNPDAVIALKQLDERSLLARFAASAHGLTTFDSARFIFLFWEVTHFAPVWLFSQSTVKETKHYGGRETIVRWEQEAGGLFDLVQAMKANGYTSGVWKAGQQVWSQSGVAVSLMGNLPVCLYTGGPFDANTGVITPNNTTHLPALWAYCSSPDFNAAVRQIDQSLKVTNATLLKVPFDLERWQKAAIDSGPLPRPHSDDPTQWLFHGHPARSTEPLHVALARLLGYGWPQNEEDGLRRFADEDGIVCLPPVAGESPAADRLRAILAAAYGDDWSPATLERLLTGVGFGGKGLDAWLRDGAGFFKQHCAHFHNRPFLWQIWDGRRDGFSAIVNYHGLDGRKLDRLIYTYLGSWIAQQRADAQANVTGADLRLSAAQALQRKLEAIREGEPPYDIYVRWKPLNKQPLGWEPDLNDGVRMNIRPFVAADVLRAKFTVNWNKDRGTNPDGSERLNDLHLTRAQKEAARERGSQR